MRTRDDQKRVQYKVTCPCGAPVAFDARGVGRPILCGACKGTIVVAWGRNAKNTQSLPVIVRHVPGPGQPARPISAAKRQTLKTQIMPQAKFFECPCGERNVLLGVGPGEALNCPACDRIHILEAAPAETAPAPARASTPPRVAPPAPSAPPPPPPPPARKPGLGEILCKCGEILPPRTSRTGREFECKACGRKGRVSSAQDAKGLPTLEAVFTFEPPSGGTTAACPCGAELSVSADLAGRTISCGGCSRALEVVAKDGRIRLRERA